MDETLPGMKYVFFFLFMNLACSMMYLQTTPDPKEIVRKAEDKMRGNTSIAVITIQTVRPTWMREMKIKAWTKGTQYALILVTAPQREQGNVFLKREKEVWNWVPSIERVIKLPPSMMSQSWMGTDFTNDDLVKESSVTDDYTHKLLGDSVVDGRSCYKIQMIPRPEAAIVWGKVIVWIDKKDFLQLRAEFYDEDGSLVNIMKSSAIKELGGKMLPSRIEMLPQDKKGNMTVLIYESLQFDTPLDDDFFSIQNMKKAK